MLKKSENHDTNYLATVVEIDNLKSHPNADRLEIFEIYGGNVIVAKGQYPVGSKVVYFPIETKINSEFLHWANLFDKPEMNADGKTKGFFSTRQQRVRPIKLREIPSEGFVYPVDKLAEFFGVSEKVFKVGESFDMVSDKVLLEKWVSGEKSVQNAVKKIVLPKWMQILPRPIRKFIGQRFYSKKDTGIGSQIVKGQFQFHYSTPQLGKSMFLIDPEDDITISDKWHGTSAVFSRVLCYQDKKWWQKLFGISHERLAKEYRNIYSSRSVIKNRRDGKYTDDVWGKWAKELFEFPTAMQDGVGIYAEIVGYVSHSKMVQKSYDYSCNPDENKLYVYRITHTDENGNVREYSFDEIQAYCELNDLKTVPVFYRGKAKDLFPEIVIDDEWRKNFLHALSEKYLEGDCQFCKNKVPAEGIVLRIESKDKKPALKLKSFRFKEKESKERDSGESNMEEES